MLIVLSNAVFTSLETSSAPRIWDRPREQHNRRLKKRRLTSSGWRTMYRSSKNGWAGRPPPPRSTQTSACPAPCYRSSTPWSSSPISTNQIPRISPFLGTWRFSWTVQRSPATSPSIAIRSPLTWPPLKWGRLEVAVICSARSQEMKNSCSLSLIWTLTWTQESNMNWKWGLLVLSKMTWLVSTIAPTLATIRLSMGF